VAIALVCASASAFQLPAKPLQLRAAAAATAVGAPALPAFAEYGKELVPGTEYGDVLMSFTNMGSAVLGMACTAVVFSKFMDFALRYGADEGCIISRAKGEEVCGKIIDRGEQGCVLTDDEGWVCA